MNLLNSFALLGISFLAAIIVVIVHEYAHAFTSWRLGDKLPKFNRRLTLGPRSHIDIVGILFMIHSGFGWGRPVETSPRHYKDKKKGAVLVGVSGPLVSLALAIMMQVILAIINAKSLEGTYNLIGYADLYLKTFLGSISVFSFNLAFISLLPVIPYDGLTIWGKVMTSRSQFRLVQYQHVMLTIFLLVVLIAPEVLGSIIGLFQGLVNWSISGIVNLIM